MVFTIISNCILNLLGHTSIEVRCCCCQTFFIKTITLFLNSFFEFTFVWQWTNPFHISFNISCGANFFFSQHFQNVSIDRKNLSIYKEKFPAGRSLARLRTMPAPKSQVQIHLYTNSMQLYFDKHQSYINTIAQVQRTGFTITHDWLP